MGNHWKHINTVPPTFLPGYLDETILEDITCVGDPFRVFVEPTTGKIHRGIDYYRQMQIEGGFDGSKPDGR